MKILGNEIKPGMIIEHKDDLWEVLKAQHVKPGKGGAFNQVEMKSVNNNTKLNERFRSSDSLEKASLEEKKFNFLYEDENDYYFINQKSFEQINIKKEIIGKKGKFLIENLEVTINFYNENPLSIELPKQIECKIDSTDVALKKQTISSSYKPAVLGNGIKIQVPPFIESGDKILVDTKTIEYVKKI
jgi:elongation factor P